MLEVDSVTARGEIVAQGALCAAGFVHDEGSWDLRQLGGNSLNELVNGRNLPQIFRIGHELDRTRLK